MPRKLAVFIVLALVCAGCPRPPDEDVPPPPEVELPAAEPLARDRVAFASNRTGTVEINVMRTDGDDIHQLTDDDEFDSWWPRISPDRGRILFYRTPAGVHDRDYGQTSLWVMGADGSGITELRSAGTDGWDVQGHAEWSPDGEQLVMFGGGARNPQIHVTTSTGRDPRPLTDRGGQNLDPSWSPDGEWIYFTGCPRAICFTRDYEIYRIRSDGSEDAERLTEDDLRDHDPYVSPDGSQVAWLTKSSDEGPVGTWGIRIADADGSNQRWVIDDGAINSYPMWSLDGGEIFFHRVDLEESTEFGIFAIRPDGTGLRELTEGVPGVHDYPSS